MGRERAADLSYVASTALVLGALLVPAAIAGGPHLLVASIAAVGWLAAGVAVVVGARRRLDGVRETAGRVANGEFGATVPVRGGDFVAGIEDAFNRLSLTLLATHEAATTDRLTGVANRATVLSRLFAEVERAARHDRMLSVAFVDLDHFKAINDTHGHPVGDVVLRGVAGILRDNLRSTDLVGRYGGEEFMVVLPETSPEGATEVAEKIRDLVQRQVFGGEGIPELRVTISVGIAGGRGAALRPEAILRDADAAMYSAKSLGRNQTYVFEEVDDDARVPSAPVFAAGRERALAVAGIAKRAAEEALTAVIDPLPHYRGKPSHLIATISLALARALELPPQEIERIRIASLLHDIGKVALPQEILEKPTSLSDLDWRYVKQHPRIGQLILDETGGLREAGKIILHHHERFSGHGYPHGLRGREIPLGSRIVAIADAYDAMTSDRPYKAAVGHDQAIAELQRHAATQFDPELVELFTRLYGGIAPEVDAELLPVAIEGVRGRRSRSRASA
ncbi:MAG TPA: diguanylate cyclase [Candidatus Limnocylindrales bacterium]|nr:diguanylate cyclase [Candidatus Limnocylindrales bacterium]